MGLVSSNFVTLLKRCRWCQFSQVWETRRLSWSPLNRTSMWVGTRVSTYIMLRVLPNKQHGFRGSSYLITLLSTIYKYQLMIRRHFSSSNQTDMTVSCLSLYTSSSSFRTSYCNTHHPNVNSYPTFSPVICTSYPFMFCDDWRLLNNYSSPHSYLFLGGET